MSQNESSLISTLHNGMRDRLALEYRRKPDTSRHAHLVSKLAVVVDFGPEVPKLLDSCTPSAGVNLPCHTLRARFTLAILCQLGNNLVPSVCTSWTMFRQKIRASSCMRNIPGDETFYSDTKYSSRCKGVKAPGMKLGSCQIHSINHSLRSRHRSLLTIVASGCSHYLPFYMNLP